MRKSISEIISTENGWNKNQLEWYQGQVEWYKKQIKMVREAGTIEFLGDLQRNLRHNQYMVKKFKKLLGE